MNMSMHMKIEHIAIWTKDLEKMKNFYVKYFAMLCGPKYTNEQKKFSSYFLSFKDSSTRLELMHRPDIIASTGHNGQVSGLAHFAISVGSKDMVNTITERLRADHFTVEGEPRTTGDGYYESVILDPEENLIELTA